MAHTHGLRDHTERGSDRCTIDARITPRRGNGSDASKKVKGRKRKLVVDTMGLFIAVTVTAASVHDRDVAAAVVAQACAKSPRLEKLYTTVCIAGNVLMTFSRPTIFVSKSFVSQVIARLGRCMLPKRHLSQLRLSAQGSWSCPCIGLSNASTRGLSAGAAR